MNKPKLSFYPGADTLERMQRIAERFDMTPNQIAAMLFSEFSHVRPEAFFEALGAIPGDLKTRPVGRPAGSTKARSEEKNHAHAHAAA